MKNLIKIPSYIFLLLTFTTNTAFSNNVNLPDFTKLVDDNNASIVNISTVRKNNKKSQEQNPQIPNDELNDFLKKFFGDKGFDNPEKKNTEKISVYGIWIYIFL